MPITKIQKEDLIRRCISVFREKGLHDTSINDLAKATGLSKSLFYHHFANKDEIIGVALSAYSEYFKKYVFVDKYSYSSPAKKLQNITQKAQRMLLRDFNGCLMGNSILEVDVHKPTFDNILNDFFDEWIKTLEDILENNTLNESPKLLAERSVMLIEGGLILTKLKREKQYLVDAFDYINSWL